MLLAALPVFADISKVGNTAPSFAGKDQNGADFKLADLTGKKVVLLYFYPEGFHRRLHEGSVELPRRL